MHFIISVDELFYFLTMCHYEIHSNFHWVGQAHTGLHLLGETILQNWGRQSNTQPKGRKTQFSLVDLLPLLPKYYLQT